MCEKVYEGVQTLTAQIKELGGNAEVDPNGKLLVNDTENDCPENAILTAGIEKSFACKSSECYEKASI